MLTLIESDSFVSEVCVDCLQRNFHSVFLFFFHVRGEIKLIAST